MAHDCTYRHKVHSAHCDSIKSQNVMIVRPIYKTRAINAHVQYIMHTVQCTVYTALALCIL